MDKERRQKGLRFRQGTAVGKFAERDLGGGGLILRAQQIRKLECDEVTALIDRAIEAALSLQYCFCSPSDDNCKLVLSLCLLLHL
jgi:hypothetical protein